MKLTYSYTRAKINKYLTSPENRLHLFAALSSLSGPGGFNNSPLSHTTIRLGAPGCTTINPAGLGIGDRPAAQPGLNIYPNPAAGFITFDLQTDKEVSRYFILRIDEARVKPDFYQATLKQYSFF